MVTLHINKDDTRWQHTETTQDDANTGQHRWHMECLQTWMTTHHPHPQTVTGPAWQPRTTAHENRRGHTTTTHEQCDEPPAPPPTKNNEPPAAPSTNDNKPPAPRKWGPQTTATRAPQHQAWMAMRALHHHAPTANEAPHHHWWMAMRAPHH